jgi:hypothetical protein
MPYIPKRHAPKKRIRWVGLAELVKIVQAESECSVEDACHQIRDALEDGAIWQLRWEPMPVSSYYCQYKLDEHVAGSGATEHVFPPPLVPGIREHFIDRRRASHWREVKMDWERGRVFDDFEREAERRLSRERRALCEVLPVLGLAPPYPKPQRPKWRTLMFECEACERIWQPAPNVKAHIVVDDGQTNTFFPKDTKLEVVLQHLHERYPQGIPAGITDKMIAADLKAKKIIVDVRTIGRARRGK